MSLRVCATTRPKHRSMALWPSPSTASTRSWGKRTKCGLSKAFLYEVSTYKELEPGLNEIMSTLAIYINSRPLITTEAASWGGLGALIGFPLKVSF